MASSAPKKAVAKKAAAKKTATKKAAPKKKTTAKKAPAKKAPAKKKDVKSTLDDIAVEFGIDMDAVEDIAVEKLEQAAEVAEKAVSEQIDKLQAEIAKKKKGFLKKIFKFIKS